MILSDTDIKAELQSGRLELRYSFLPVEGRYCATDHAVGPYEEPDIPTVREHFERHLTRGRVSLSLGPLLKPLNTFRRVPRSQRYADHKNVVDLRRCDRGWPLSPKHAAIAFTNEWVRLPDNLVGIVFSRVRSYNKGLLAASSYVDSTWEGILKMHLVNHSARTVRLHLGDEMARLFVINSNGGESIGPSLATKGSHYGFNWAQILEDQTDPFPTNGGPSRPSLWEVTQNTNDFVKNYWGYGLIAVATLGVLGGVQLYVQLTTAIQLSSRVDALHAQVGQLQGSTVQSGIQPVAIKAGSTDGQANIDLVPNTSLNNGSAYVSAQPLNAAGGSEVHPKVHQRAGRLILTLTVTLSQPAASDTSVDVQWLVAP